MKREYSYTMLPIVEGKPIPRSAVILDNGEWKTRWWYPEPDGNVDKPCSSALEAVVYCKDCKHFRKVEKAMVANQYCGNLHRAVTNDWFCADGVAKE